jgi:putative Mn2+ efflux pump MntP
MDWSLAGIVDLLGIAVGLSMDAVAVSIGAGMTISPITGRHVFRLAFHFGLFQCLMPILGWLAGQQLAVYFGGWDHWIAFVLLSLVGAKMIRESFDHENERQRDDPSRGLLLLTLCVATSIDALAVGLSMALLGVSIWIPAAVIGLVTASLSTLGIFFGTQLGRRWGRAAEALGGCVLVGIGLRILIEHLTSH